MLNLATVSDLIAERIAAQLPAELARFAVVGMLAAPPADAAAVVTVALERADDLVTGNMTCRCNGSIRVQAGGDNAADLAADAAALRQLMQHCTAALAALGGSVLTHAEGGALVYECHPLQQTLLPDRTFTTLLAQQTFDIFLQF